MHFRLTEDPHRRLNVLTNEWVLVSPHRTARPWQGEVAKTLPQEIPKYDPACYLCPGNPRFGGDRNPTYTSTFVFDNDFAALQPGVAAHRSDVDCKGLLVAEGESGICRVMCFSPRHDLTLSTMAENDLNVVVQTWVEQFRDLAAQKEIRHVQIFENRGAIMGASNPHPHCQIWSTSSIPEVAAKELIAQKGYLSSHNRCLLCDYLDIEQQQDHRLICRSESFSVVVPFWAVWPFEVLICSRRHLGSMLDFSAAEVQGLAAILQQVTSAYDRLFDTPFPYSMGFHQSPTDGFQHPEWHFHAHFYPPLLRSSSIKKFMVGFEMLGTPQRDITPESAAERLRELIQAN
ncbi:MAG TPA: UDP-glucose--hexose-1-phosphate uridylyltransferase [Candidatus Sulfotelmatobacter sp.]